MLKNLSQKKFILILLAILVISAGIVTVLSLQNNPQNITNQNGANQNSTKSQNSQNSQVELSKISSSPATENVSQAKEVRKIDKNEFAKHSNKNDCWVSYDKKVYDVTLYLKIHPGGERSIAKYCSQEIDEASANHPGGPFGSIKIKDILAPMYVGDLVE